MSIESLKSRAQLLGLILNKPSQETLRDPSIPDEFYDYLKPIKLLPLNELKSFYLHDFLNTLTSTSYLGFLTTPENVKDTLASLTRKGKAQDVTNLHEYSEYMKTLSDYVVSEECKPKLETPPYFSIRNNIKYIPTSAFLVDRFIDMIGFFEHPNKDTLDKLKSKKIKASSILKKFPHFHYNETNEDLEIDGAEALMLYISATKINSGFSGITVHPDGTISYNNSTDTLPVERFERYDANTNATPATTQEFNEKKTSFSFGLYAAELLGHATNKEFVMRKVGDETDYTLEIRNKTAK